MKRFFVLAGLLAGLAISPAVAEVPQGIACVEPTGAKERISTLEGTEFLPDVVLTSNTKIVRWTNSGSGQVYGFLQIDDCAVPKVFYLGLHKPVTAV